MGNHGKDEDGTVAVTVQELATGASQESKSVARFPSVPLHLSLLITMVPAIALAVIPACVILFETMDRSTNSLSQTILTDTMNSIVSGLETALLSAEHGTTAVSASPAIVELFSGSPPYYKNAALNMFVMDQLAYGPLGNPMLGICQRFNLTGGMPTGTSSDTLVQVTWRTTTVSYCDWTSPNACWIYYTNTTTGVPDPQPFQQLYFPGPKDRKRILSCLIIDDCPPKGVWKAELIFGAFYMTFGKCSRGNPTPLGASIVVDGGTIMKDLLSHIQPTNNSRLFAVGDKWKMIVSNSKTYEDINQTSKDFYSVSSAPDNIIAELGTVLQAQVNGNQTNIASLEGKVYTASLKTDNSQNWYYMVQTLDLNILSPLVLVAAIPYADFFDDIRKSQRTSIALTASFGVASLIVVAIIAIGITMPVRTLTKIMTQVTKFDFSTLEAGGLKEDNLFTEIREMEKTFNIMVKAFASAIKRNKSLVSGSVNSTGQASKHGR